MGKVRLELNSLTARHTLNWLDSPEADFHFWTILTKIEHFRALYI